MNKRFFIRILKGLFIFAGGVIALVFTIYSVTWYALTLRANAYLQSIWQDQSIAINGKPPELKGFPNPPEAEFSGTIEHRKSGLKLNTPLLYYSGFPVTGQLQYLEAPGGLNISAPFLDQNLDFKFAALQVQVPYQFPLSARKTDIQNWQKSESPFIIHKIILKSDKITAIGTGAILLDENLQIKADIQAKITGMDVLFDDMAKQYGERTMSVARNLLNAMSRIDSITGEKYFETTLKIQNRGVFFGPMRISGLPEIKWDE